MSEAGEHVEVRAGAYRDSVSLMRLSRSVAEVGGVLAAQVAMGTDLNLEVLAGQGFAVPAGTGPQDLVVAVRAQDGAALAAALAVVERELAGRAAPGGAAGGAVDGSAQGLAPRTAGAAVRATGAGLVLVSVPGDHAVTEAADALAAGAHVMVFSDNVPVEDEVRLKALAAEQGLLVMGPDCGTAVVAGVGLGFANVVRPGPVGLAAASGTGAQQLMCLLDAAGVGVSHCLGLGGRDLSAAVGGRSTRAALAMLDADPGTELIVVVSKPADPGVAAEVRAFADALATPVQWAVLGPGRPDLTEAARQAVVAAGGTWHAPRSWPVAPDPAGRYAVLRGAFAGGTLCEEAAAITGLVGARPRGLAELDRLDPLASALVDFGDDELTRGRPHPMIDETLRAQWIRGAGAGAGAPGRGVVLLLDVVLGHGAHPDPAAELVPALGESRGAATDRGVALAAVVSLCGSAGDPQGLVRQAEALHAAGASVYLSNADAARAAQRLTAGATRVVQA